MLEFLWMEKQLMTTKKKSFTIWTGIFYFAFFITITTNLTILLANVAMCWTRWLIARNISTQLVGVYALQAHGMQELDVARML